MKSLKLARVAVAIAVCLLPIFSLFGCSPKAESYKDEEKSESNEDKEKPQSYEGKEIAKITYSSVDYFGGHTKDYLLNFSSDTASKRSYMPHYDTANGIPEYQQFADFTESEATVFFDKCYAGGLFSLKESYVTDEIINDGGGWSLTIEYVDGTTFSSTGDNAGPDDVFEECMYAFYELCGEGVVGTIPSYYKVPPDLFLSFRYKIGTYIYDDNSLARNSRGNYLWNGHSASGTSYYEVNRELSKFNEFDSNCQYTFALSIQSYQYYNIRKFDKFTLTCYDFNEEMSGGEEIFSSGWFTGERFPLQFDKIYIYRLYWENGDFAEFTFNTKLCT